MSVTTRRMTLEDFLNLPEEKPAFEFADGEVTQKVSPQGMHSRLQFWLLEQLSKAGEPDKIALAFPELRVTFGGVSRVPDISVYRWTQVPTDASGRIENTFAEPPSVAIEIVSPEQRVSALVRRCLWYVANGVEIALIVDPLDETVLAFRPGGQTAAWRGQDRIDMSEIFPAFQLTVDELFASLTIQE